MFLRVPAGPDSFPRTWSQMLCHLLFFPPCAEVLWSSVGLGQLVCSPCVCLGVLFISVESAMAWPDPQHALCSWTTRPCDVLRDQESIPLSKVFMQFRGPIPDLVSLLGPPPAPVLAFLAGYCSLVRTADCPVSMCICGCVCMVGALLLDPYQDSPPPVTTPLAGMEV